MNFVFLIWYLFQCWIAIYLVIPFLGLLLYFLKFTTNTRYNISKKAIVHHKNFDFAAIITVHKDILLVPALIDSLLKQHYKQFTIYVVADACEKNDLQYDDPRVVILRPEQDLNAKVLSIDFAIDHFIKSHDALVILDPDNLVHPQFFQVLNQYFQKGYRAVQTNLQPKNTDSIFAKLDSMGDVFYNFIEREMRMEIGFSSAIWGSGIAIETSLYKDIVYDTVLGGFDKRIQAFIVQKVPQLAFAKEAYLYDEKISNGSALEKQRTRWLYAYFRYAKLGWQTFTSGLKRMNFNLSFFGFFNLRPPLFIVYLIGILFCVYYYFNQPALFLVWLIILSLFILSFISIVLLRSSNKKNIWSVFFMPVFIFYQMTALIKIKRARKTFLKTEHSKLIYIEDLLRNESI